MRILITLALVASLFTLNAQITVSSNIEEVTVFRNNAELTNLAKAILPAGTSEIIIKDISTAIRPNSLQVQIAGNNVSLLSAVYENNYIDDLKPSDELQGLKDQLEGLQADLKWAKEQKQIYRDLENALNQNIKLGGTEVGYKASDLSIFLETYKTKQYEYNKAYLKFEKEEKDIAIEVNQVQRQLNDANAKFSGPSGVLRLQVSAVAPVTANFKCSYIINNAGWAPIYDLRSEGTNQDVSLAYKANIYQNSGYDWERVQLVVSTGNPSQNNNRPILNPQYVDFYAPVAYTTGAYGNGRMQKVAAPEMNMAYEDVEMEVAAEMDFQDGYAYDANVSENQLNVEFEVSLPQNIPSDGRYHLVGMESYDLPSSYVYHAVPKKDKTAFLLAQVSDWGQFNLLPGQANIFFEGAYVGQSVINPNQTADTLLLSMGRDEGIKVKRNQLVDFTSKKFMGGNKKETFAYEIEVRNTKNYGIDIEILDQIPVSRNKEITVEMEEKSGALYNEELGRLEWNLKLAAGETKKVRLIYSVKYPKDKTITGL